MDFECLDRGDVATSLEEDTADVSVCG